MQMCKILFSVFHLSKRFGNLLPDSAILIIVGLGLGFLLKAIGLDPSVYRLNSDVFFLFLLPPIIYDAGMQKMQKNETRKII